MGVEKKLWPLDAQTEGKHIVLRAYLNAWLPILGMTQGRIIFIDAFAGPGEYEGGEDGSPLIALKAYEGHLARNRIKEIVFLFIEGRRDRAEHLERLVAPFRERLSEAVIPPVECDNCLDALTRALDGLEARGSQLAPAFVMLDPFGFSDTPMSFVARLLRNDKAEVYISVMWQWLNRFKEEEKVQHHFDDLFGASTWRDALALPHEEVKPALVKYYEQGLRASGARFVTHFELWNGNRHIYTIFFATKHPKGMDMMKQAIWKADRSGGYVFRGRTGVQLEMDIESTVDLTPFGNEIHQVFGGRETNVAEIEAWAMTDATDYHSGQLRKALKLLEDAGLLTARSAIPGKVRRRRTFPDNTLVSIIPQA